MKKKQRAPQLLLHAVKTYRTKNKLYGDSYRQHGKIMLALFPNGVTLRTVEDFNRYGIINMAVSKLYRYTTNLSRGGHKDSAHDLINYSAMLEELTDD